MARSLALAGVASAAIAATLTLVVQGAWPPSATGVDAGESRGCSVAADGQSTIGRAGRACDGGAAGVSPIALAPARATSGVRLVEIVSATGEANAVAPYAFVPQAIECPDGMLALGGGFRVLDADGSPIARPIAASEPLGEPASAWSVTASLDVGMAVKVYAVCALTEP
jgi:hypothetical protein